MNPTRLQAGRHMLQGTTRVLLADGLALPTGLLVLAFLTRRLGPEGFGSFAIVSNIVVWIEASINTIFHRPTIKAVSASADWMSVGPAIIRMHIRISVAATAIICGLSPLLGHLMRDERLPTYLWLFSLDIPLAGLADAHKNLLVGTGGFRQRAFSSAARWLGRLLLIIVMVEVGLSLEGAILGNIGASLVELLMLRTYIRPRLLGQIKTDLSGFWYCFWPLVLFSISVTLFSRADLIALKILGGTADQAGMYAAAQSLTVVPGFLVMSFSPLLLATVSRLVSSGDIGQVKEIASGAIRFPFILLPFAGMAAGMSSQIVKFTFGVSFLNAAAVFSVLIFGAVAMIMISIVIAILTGAGQPKWALVHGATMLPLAAAGHLFFVPRFGPLGAAAVTTVCASLGAASSVRAAYHLWQIFPPFLTVSRAILITVIVYVLAASDWPGYSGFVILKAGVISVVICGCFFLLREFEADEIAFLASAIGSKRSGSYPD